MRDSIKLHFLLVSEEALVQTTTDDLPRVTFVQPILNLGVPFLPTQQAFSISIGFFYSRDMVQKMIAAELLSPMGDKINRIEWEIQEPNDHSDTHAAGVVVANLRNVVFDTAGEHKVQVLIGENVIGETTFFVNLQKG